MLASAKFFVIPELVQMVVDAIDRSETLGTDELRALRLVNSSLRAIASPALFKHITLFRPAKLSEKEMTWLKRLPLRNTRSLTIYRLPRAFLYPLAELLVQMPRLTHFLVHGCSIPYNTLMLVGHACPAIQSAEAFRDKVQCHYVWEDGGVFSIRFLPTSLIFGEFIQTRTRVREELWE